MTAVLAGSILESVLYTFLQGQEAYIALRRGEEFTFDPKQGLENYVNIFNRWFLDVLPNAELPDFVVDYRDLVHINRELRELPDVCIRASREMLRVLNLFLGELQQFAPERVLPRFKEEA